MVRVMLFFMLFIFISCRNKKDVCYDYTSVDYQFSKEIIGKSRQNTAISFGSCSFQEPIDDLTQLGWM